MAEGKPDTRLGKVRGGRCEVLPSDFPVGFSNGLILCCMGTGKPRK
jgi:hypothetical protein